MQSDNKTNTMTLREKGSLLAHLLKGSLGFFLLGILCAALTAGVEMLVPDVIRMTIDSVIGTTALSLPGYLQTILGLLGITEGALQAALVNGLLLAAGFIGAISLLGAVFRYGNTLYIAKGAETFVERTRNRLLSHLQQLPYGWHISNATGDIIQRCTSDVETIRSFVADQLVSIFRIAILTVFSLIFMYAMNVRLALVASAMLPVIIAYSIILESNIGKKFEAADVQEGVLSSIAQENLTGIRVVRAFGREATEREKFEQQNTAYANLMVRLLRTMAWFWGAGDLISGIQIMLVLVLGTVFTVQGHMTTGELIAFIAYNTMLSWPLRQLGRVVAEMSKAGVAITRVGYILNSEPERDKPNATTPDMTGDICFDHVSFSYVPETKILDDVSFTIPTGTVFGILGGTGSGKSTLTLLLDRLYSPTEGKITVGGQDIAHMQAGWVRRNVGLVLQEPFLFAGTLEENIGITQQSTTLEQVRSAARVASLDDNVMTFAKGYDTVVGERGVTLSGGQKQRAAIARMLMENTPIMVFDDSLSAVDAETDARIRAALQKRFGGATVILISHRITSLMSADSILVLENGRVAELGSHDQLMENNGIYRHIYDMQKAGLEEGETA